MRKNLKIALSAIVLVGVSAIINTSTVSAATTPVGAVKLPASSLKKVSGVQCGVVKGSWVAGTIVQKVYFISHTQQAKNAKNDAKKVKGSKATALQKTATKWTGKATAQQPSCATLKKPASSGSTSKNALKFNIKNATGLALRSPSVKKKGFASKSAAVVATEGSNLETVSATGVTADAVTSGTAVIEKFLIAPNDKLYVLFAEKTSVLAVDGTAKLCLMAEISKSTGNPVCIESELDSINWNADDSFIINDAVQFDDAGAIYYTGLNSGTGKNILRKYVDGVATMLINDNIVISDFLVMGDGSVFLTGDTASTKGSWTRKISTTGGLSNLATEKANFLQMFPDKNVYYGLNSAGIKRYLTATNAEDQFPYIARTTASTTPRMDISRYCASEPTANNSYISVSDGFCAYAGMSIRQKFSTLSKKVYVNAGVAPMGTLMQYYPDVKRAVTAVHKISVAQTVIDNIILAGVNLAGKNIITIYNTADDSELSLLDGTADNEIEVYHLNLTSSNKIMFDGLRFKDNKYVLAQIDLTTGVLTSAQTGGSKLVDFQTFSS